MGNSIIYHRVMQYSHLTKFISVFQAFCASAKLLKSAEKNAEHANAKKARDNKHFESHWNH